MFRCILSLIFLSSYCSAWKIAWRRITQNLVTVPRECPWRPSKLLAWSPASTTPAARIWQSVAPTIAASRACIPLVWTVETVSVAIVILYLFLIHICIMQTSNFVHAKESHKVQVEELQKLNLSETNNYIHI